MNRQLFAELLESTAQQAYEDANLGFNGELPANLMFRVRLNSLEHAEPHYHEGFAYPDFPEDSSFGTARAARRMDFESAVDLLWRDGQVPDWVSVGIVSRSTDATIIGVRSCGRFTYGETSLGQRRPELAEHDPWCGTELLDYEQRGSLFYNFELCDREDLELLHQVRGEVGYLTVKTDEFDVDQLTELPDMPGLTGIKHVSCSLQGDIGAALARFTELNSLQIWFTDRASPLLGGSNVFPKVSNILLYFLPDQPWGAENVATSFPAATKVFLLSRGPLWLEGPFGEAVTDLHLDGERLAGSPVLPTSLTNLNLMFTDTAGLATALATVRKIEERLIFSSTPVGDRLLTSLVRRVTPRSVMLFQCGVSNRAVRRLNQELPGTTVLGN